MTSSSSAKKVRKAAKAGGSGGPKVSSDRGLLYPIAIVTICILGLALVVVSRADNSSDPAADDPIVADEFAATYGIFDCTDWVATSPGGDAAPFTIPLASAEAERNGRLDRWGPTVGIELSSDALVVTGIDPEINRATGEDCEGEEGTVFLTVWSSNDQVGEPLEDVEVQTITEDIGAYRPHDGDVIAIAFAPEGTEMEEPPVSDGASQPGTDTSEADTGEPDTSGADSG